MRNIDGVGPLGNIIEKEEPSDFKGGKDSSKREVGGMKCALKNIL